MKILLIAGRALFRAREYTMNLARFFRLPMAGLAFVLGLGVSSTNVSADTATQYFPQVKVGDSWTYLVENSATGTFESVPAYKSITTVSAVTGGKVTFQTTDTSQSPQNSEYDAMLDATGAWTNISIAIDTGKPVTHVRFPATFSTGTSWAVIAGVSISNTIEAINVTRTVTSMNYSEINKLIHSWQNVATWPAAACVATEWPSAEYVVIHEI